MALPSKLALEIVTPEGLLLRDEVEEVIAPGEQGYFGVRPGHTPLMATLGIGELSYRKQDGWHRLTCFSGWCEVLPDRVNVLADIGERAGGHRRRPGGAGPEAGGGAHEGHPGRGRVRGGPPRLRPRRDPARRRPQGAGRGLSRAGSPARRP